MLGGQKERGVVQTDVVSTCLSKSIDQEYINTRLGVRLGVRLGRFDH